MQDQDKAIDTPKEAKQKKVVAPQESASPERAGASSPARSGRTGPMIMVTMPIEKRRVSAEVEEPTATFLEDYRLYLKAHTGREILAGQVLDGIAKFVGTKDKSFRAWRDETRNKAAGLKS